MNNINIITATYQEARILKNLSINVSGIGGEKAYKKAKYLISKGASFIISFGVATALAPYVKVGDVIIPKVIISHERTKLYVDLQWHTNIMKRLIDSPYLISYKSLLEVRSVIMDTKQKKMLYMETGCIAADMESAAILKAAIEANIPFICIRAISDSYNMKIPEWVIESIQDSGRLSYSSFIKGLFSHPLDIIDIIKLSIGFNKVKRSLNHVMFRIYPSLPL